MACFLSMACVKYATMPEQVVITTLEFPATLAYYAAPAASPHAYLQAKARNDSDYPLLASSNMGVYVDGSFITKTELKTVNPREVSIAVVGVCNFTAEALLVRKMVRLPAGVQRVPRRRPDHQGRVPPCATHGAHDGLGHSD
jgi:hypothetical protein